MIKFDKQGNIIRTQEVKQELEVCKCGKIRKNDDFWVENTTQGTVCGFCYTKMLRKEDLNDSKAKKKKQ